MKKPILILALVILLTGSAVYVLIAVRSDQASPNQAPPNQAPAAEQDYELSPSQSFENVEEGSELIPPAPYDL